MAKYPSILQTKNGRILIAKSNASGKALVPIKIVAGDGLLTNQNIETMENVIDPLLELPFASPGRYVKEGQFQLDFALSNEHLEHGFYAREIGVFAKLQGEDDSTAVMIAYTNGGNFVDYIPAKDTPINSKVFEVTIAVDNAANVIVQRSDAAYITAGEMERHNSDEHAHDNRFASIIEKVNNMITPNDDADKQTLAPTLALVKTLLSGLTIKNGQDVVKALGNETLQSLGVRYDLSNTNAWYVSFGKLFGGLIIQGGLQSVGYSDNNPGTKAEYKFTLPIAYKTKCLHASGTTETNLTNGWTFINVNYAPNKSNNTELTFHCWTDWDWSLHGFRLNVVSIGF